MSAHRKTKIRHSKTNAKVTGKRRQPKNANITSQVRIIGGQYKRQLIPFIEADGLRPSPDRLRETIFNWLQFDLHNAQVLDVCAGSGVLGFESLSRGAQSVTFIELQPNQTQLIQQTAQRLRLPADAVNIYTGDALQVLDQLVENSAYHVVFIDPPYDANLWVALINKLLQLKLVTHSTLIYVEDRRHIAETLNTLQYQYTVLKHTKVGQIEANLITLNITHDC